MSQTQEEYKQIVEKYGYQYLAGKQVKLCFNCVHWTHPTGVTGCELVRCPVSPTKDFCSDREVKNE